MMLIFGGKGFEHVKEMEMAEMAEMALKFLWNSPWTSFTSLEQSVYEDHEEIRMFTIAKRVLTTTWVPQAGTGSEILRDLDTFVCQNWKSTAYCSRFCLPRDRSMDSSTAPGSCNRPIDLSFLRAALKSRLEVRSNVGDFAKFSRCMVHLCKSLQ
jgi:hypothetical protein